MENQIAPILKTLQFVAPQKLRHSVCAVRPDTKRSEFVCDSNLIRGADLKEALRRGGSALTSISHDHEEYFLKSREVSALDVFICHTWDTERSSKFAALALYSNILQGLLAAVLLTVTLMTLDVFEIVPTWTRYRGGKTLEFSPWCVLCVCPCYWLVLILYRDLPFVRGPTVFIDKLCIDQSNSDRRKQGIDAIPAIISKSDAMVVILTTSGLTKVWTMFEISAFLLLHGPSNLKVYPALLSKMCFLGSLIVYVGIIGCIGINSIGTASLQIWVLLGVMVITLPPSALLVQYVYHWGAEIKMLHHQAQHFNFDTATCTVEADRVLLKGLITDLFRKDDINEVDQPCQTDRKVRDHAKQLQIMVADSVQNALGRSGLPMRFMLSMTLAVISLDCDSLSCDLRRRRLGLISANMAAQAVLRAVTDASFYLALGSVFCYFVIRSAHDNSASRCTWFAKIKLVLILVLGTLVFPVAVLFAYLTARLLLSDQEASLPVVAAFSLVCLTNFCLIGFFHIKCCYRGR